MLFGNKERFAIYIEINNFFHDNSVGEGIFNVYIKNECFGVQDKFSTTFLCIIDELKKFYLTAQNENLNLNQYSKQEIAQCYYDQYFTESDLSKYSDDLLAGTRLIVEWAPESAFDDGSHIIHIDEKKMTRIIGFRSCMCNEICKVLPRSEKEIYIEKEELKKILLEAIEFLNNSKI